MAAALAKAVGSRLRRGSDFPFRLGGKPPIGPIAVGFGFVPADVNHRQIFIQRNIFLEDPLLPATVGFPSPIDRVIKSLFETRRFPRFIYVFVKEIGERTFQVSGSIAY